MMTSYLGSLAYKGWKLTKIMPNSLKLLNIHSNALQKIRQWALNYRDLETELPYHIPSFKDVFLRVIELHESPKTYKFGEDAMKSFIEYHDAVNERKLSTVDNNMRGVLSKAKGQSARLATILHSDEGLTLETSAFRISVRWPIYIINSVDKTKFLYTILYVADHCIKSASSQLDNTDQLPLEVGKEIALCKVIRNPESR